MAFRRPNPLSLQRPALLSAFFTAAWLAPCAAIAQDANPMLAPPPEASQVYRGTVSTYVSASHLNANLGNWREVGLSADLGFEKHGLHGEIAHTKRFDQAGTFAAVGDTYTFNEDWYGSLTVGAGDGAFYLPKYRVDAFINRKLLSDRSLVATLGTGVYRAPDGHRDRSLTLGLISYPMPGLVLQGEVRFNRSQPGSVNTHQQLLAVTWGPERQTQFRARYIWGGEGYQTLGAGAQLVDFQSRQGSLGLRHWVGERWGVDLRADLYSNPSYRRQSLTAALFMEIP